MSQGWGGEVGKARLGIRLWRRCRPTPSPSWSSWLGFAIFAIKIKKRPEVRHQKAFPKVASATDLALPKGRNHNPDWNRHCPNSNLTPHPTYPLLFYRILHTYLKSPAFVVYICFQSSPHPNPTFHKWNGNVCINVPSMWHWWKYERANMETRISEDAKNTESMETCWEDTKVKAIIRSGINLDLNQSIEKLESIFKKINSQVGWQASGLSPRKFGHNCEFGRNCDIW